MVGVIECIELLVLPVYRKRVLREVIGAGTFAGIPVPFFSTYNIPILTQTPGGFFVFGCLIALVARITHGKVKHAATGCGNCPNAAVCGKIGKEA